MFEHEPLDFTKPVTRVVSILPGSGEIGCLVRTADIGGSYTALSYVWGDPEPTQQIRLNGKTLYVRENLHKFLRQARENRILDPLWIDALCIDQNNTQERNHQVQQMGSIYSNAQRVISWLGEGDNNMVKYFRLACEISREVAKLKAEREGTSRSTRTETLFYLLVHRRRFANKDFGQLLQAFCHLKYFKRTWIVQEVLLSRHAHVAMYGNVSLDWNDLKATTLTSVNQLSNKLEKGPAMPFLDLSIPASGLSEREAAIELINRFGQTECSDPRDHIFALRTLWDNSVNSLDVDYGVSRVALFQTVMRLFFPSTTYPLSTIITMLDMLKLESVDLIGAAPGLSAQDSDAITITALWSREFNMEHLLGYRTHRLVAANYHFSKHTDEHDLKFCKCWRCVQLPELPADTIFREYVLRRRDHDRTGRTRMDEELYLLEIVTPSNTYFGLVEGDLQDSDVFLAITPKWLNQPYDVPRTKVQAELVLITLSLRCLVGLLSNLRPDVCIIDSKYLSTREGYWGIDCEIHENILDGSYTDVILNQRSMFNKGGIDGNPNRMFWGRCRWRSEMQRRDREAPRRPAW